MESALQLSPDLSVVINYNGDKAVVYDRTEHKKYHLNKAALHIILMLEKGLSVSEIIRLISGKKEQYITQISDLVTELQEQKILVDANATKKSAIIRKNRFTPALKSIQFEITRRCNLRCKHCYLEDYSGKGELSTDEVFDLIDEAANIGVESFDITGGEPLLRKDLKQVIQRVYQKGMYSKLYTNATQLDDDFIMFLKTIGIEAVKISLDGFNPKTHDEFRRAKNSFSKALANIKKLKAAGIPVEVGSVITKVNLSEAQELIDFLKNELKVHYHIDSFVPIGQGLPNIPELTISDEDYIAVMKDEVAEVMANTPEELSPYESPFFCGAGNNYVFINCRGSVKFCPSMSDDLNGGNIRDHSLTDIWLSGGIFQEYRNVNCKYFDSCPHARHCKGGCRSRSISKYGGMKEPDLQMCKMFLAITGVKSPALLVLEETV
jgi:radical SAM protein with 4Fe4S-binding SPASM domain